MWELTTQSNKPHRPIYGNTPQPSSSLILLITLRLRPFPFSVFTKRSVNISSDPENFSLLPRNFLLPHISFSLCLSIHFSKNAGVCLCLYFGILQPPPSLRIFPLLFYCLFFILFIFFSLSLIRHKRFHPVQSKGTKREYPAAGGVWLLVWEEKQREKMPIPGIFSREMKKGTDLMSA